MSISSGPMSGDKTQGKTSTPLIFLLGSVGCWTRSAESRSLSAIP